MNISNIKIVSRYEAKVLRRSWLFRLLILFSLVGVSILQILHQGSTIRWASWNMIALPSYVPYVNVYLFGIIQTVVVVFFAVDLLGGNRKIDTITTIYVRSMSNADYVIGKAWGAVRIFMGVSLLSLLAGMGINIFLSDAPFNGGMYFFYWIVFLFPSLVFMIGFTFLGVTIIRNKPLTILLLLSCLFFMFYLNKSLQGCFDFLGLGIPNTLSDITGYPDLLGVLLQRLLWLFLGMGLIGYTVLLFKRLPNHSGYHGVQCGASTLFVVFGLGCGLMLFLRDYNYASLRDDYRLTYEKYRPNQKLTLEKQNITYHQDGDILIVKTCLRLRNEHTEKVNPLILYLNPGLKIDRLLRDGEKINFSRDNQVIIIDETLDKSETLNIVMEYSGKIDETICYLELPDDRVSDTKAVVGAGLFHSNRRYAIAEDDYTLLTPECLWYPVAVPPVNLSNVYAVEKNFTQYNLQVVGARERTILSQGDRKESGDTLSFMNKHGLTGISLCIGDYKCYRLMVDSVVYEFYVVEGHDDFLKYLSNIKDSMQEIISDYKKKIEDKNERKYPYKRFMLVETPISYASYYRNERGGSESIQPEMVFLPEKGVGFWTMNLKEATRSMNAIKVHMMKTDTDIERKILEQLLDDVFSKYGNKSMRNPLWFSLVSSYSPLSKNNPYALSSLFYDYVNYFYSPEYPIVDMVLSHSLRNPDVASYTNTAVFSSPPYKKAMNYLKNHSLEDALKDSLLTSDILYQIVKLKSAILKNQYFDLNISNRDFDVFMRQYWEEHQFERVNFSSFDKEFTEKFGISYLSAFLKCYTIDRVPSFVIQDAYIEDINDNKQKKDFMVMRSRIYVSIYNDSDVDGMVTLSCDELSEGKLQSCSMVQHILVEAGKAKEIVVIPEGRVYAATLNMGISKNIPTITSIPKSLNKTEKCDVGIRDIDSVRFFPKKGELIVDNESDDFRVLQTSENKRLRQWFHSEPALDYVDYNRMSTLNLEEWQLISKDNFYGKHIKSGWVKKGGKGNAKAEWSVNIKKSGYYEVFVYIPDKARLQEFKPIKNKGDQVIIFSRNQNQEPVMQYYLVQHDGQETEVSVEIGNNMTYGGWHSLGNFYFSSGETSVLLTDKESINDQFIYADAVKWVIQEE